MSQRPLNIIIACGGTGGHLFPGIAVAQELRKQGHRPILLISRKDIDAEASGKYGDLEFHSVPAIAKPPLLSLRTPAFFAKLLSTYLSCRRLIKRERCDVVLGMGGFTSLPPIIAGRHLGRLCYVHDSNALPGRANRLTARWCQRVLIGLPEAAAYFPGRPSQVVGTPCREEFNSLPSPEQAYASLGLSLNSQQALILVVGGSQGARQLNSQVVEAAKQQPEVRFLIIAGSLDYERVSQLAADASNISVLGFCSQMAAAYAAADGIIARAGASTLTELAHIGKASMLIPLPSAADDHQSHNARAFSSKKAAIHCPQSELNAESLRHFVQDIVLNEQARSEMERAIRQFDKPDAAAQIASIIACPKP